MGQKVHPVGFRIGITEDWRSRWYAPKAAYGEFLIEDQKIRRFINHRLNDQPPYAAVSHIEIERTRNDVKVIIHTARPGVVIGPKGAEVDKLKDSIEDLIDRTVTVNVMEVRSPDINAQLVAASVAEQLKKRAGFRRTLKQRADAAIGAGVLGIKLMVSGRLNGAEMARCETLLRGSIPLHTLQSHVDYGYAISRTTYGTIGVKCWLYKGRYGEEVDAETEDQQGRRRGYGRGKRG